MTQSSISGGKAGHTPNYAVTLPVEPDQFTAFISGLLGKPQTINRILPGPFEVTRADISDVHHLIEQRIKSQNKASLIQFIAKIIYDDGSSVQLNSFTDFAAYNEVRPLRSRAVHLSWVYLIQFMHKNVPEKQQIDLSIITGGERALDIDEDLIQNARHARMYASFLQLRISHTDRTWGADLDALLSGRLAHLQKELTGVRKSVSDHSLGIGLLTGFLVLALLAYGLIQGASAFDEANVEAMRAIVVNEPTISTVSKQIENLFTIVAVGGKAQFGLLAIVGVIGGIIAAIVAGSVVGNLATQDRPSFLLLTRLDEEDFRKADKNSGFRQFLISIPATLVLGIAANYLFHLLSTYLALSKP